MNDLSCFITAHPNFSVFLVLAAVTIVAVLADGIKGRRPK